MLNQTTAHYLLRCSFYTHIRKTLVDNVTDIIGPLTRLSDDKMVRIFLFGDDAFTDDQNSSIMQNTIVFLKLSERFDTPLF